MPLSKNVPRKAIVAASLLVWFTPTCYLVLRVSQHTVTQKMILFPVITGLAAASWLRELLSHEWCLWAFAAVISITLPVGFIFAMLRFRRWFVVILAVEAVVCFLMGYVALILMRH